MGIWRAVSRVGTLDYPQRDAGSGLQSRKGEARVREPADRQNGGQRPLDQKRGSVRGMPRLTARVRAKHIHGLDVYSEPVPCDHIIEGQDMGACRQETGQPSRPAQSLRV